jgi:hypothetical protein
LSHNWACFYRYMWLLLVFYILSAPFPRLWYLRTQTGLVLLRYCQFWRFYFWYDFFIFPLFSDDLCASCQGPAFLWGWMHAPSSLFFTSATIIMRFLYLVFFFACMEWIFQMKWYSLRVGHLGTSHRWNLERWHF